MTETEPPHWHEAVSAARERPKAFGALLQGLLERDPGLIRASHKGRTLLHHAADTVSIEAIKTLVASGADPNASMGPYGTVQFGYPYETGNRPLHALALSPFIPRAEACIKALRVGQADINARNASGKTPLHLASRHNERLVPAFLEHGADVNARNGSGKTPLHLAVSYNQSGAVTALIEAGADVNARDDKGRTPLHGAAMEREFENDWEIMLELIQAGAEVDARDGDGATALHLAAATDFKSAATLLLEQGANPLAKDNKGRLPVDYVPQPGIPELLHIASEKWLTQEKETAKAGGTDPVTGSDPEPGLQA